MGLDHSLVGVPSEPQVRSWDSKDALLYAVGVGAGLGDPLQELEFTTENCQDIEQKVLPTFAVLIAQARPSRSLGDFDRALLVHAEQAFELHRPLPVAGTVRTTSTVTGIYDKGSAALAVSENVAVDAATGEPLVTSRTSAFIRGEGGFGGERGTDPPWERPDREPDYQVIQQTRPEQALIYRLSGDRNPLHVDPKFAARGGFSQPILHGLCTYGVTGRALLHALCNSDPARFGSMSGRFSRPVLPGEPLTVFGLAAGRQRYRAVPDHEAGRHRGDRPGAAAGARIARVLTGTGPGPTVTSRADQSRSLRRMRARWARSAGLSRRRPVRPRFRGSRRGRWRRARSPRPGWPAGRQGRAAAGPGPGIRGHRRPRWSSAARCAGDPTAPTGASSPGA